jgi:hypothetical protein
VIAEALPLNPIARWEWVFPVVESLHICGFTLLAGFATAINLRLLGLCLRRQRIADVAATLAPWMWGGFVVQIVTGTFLFSGDPGEYLQVAAFRNKMLLIVIAALFQFLVVRRATAPGRDLTPAAANGLIALISLALWTSVLLAGMWIGNL